jgi:chemotaxis protein MotB
MADDSGSSPIIIKKIKKGGGGHHGGAWKVAYADFVTAMMALFIVLWILGQSPQVKDAVSGYFKDPIGFSSKKGKDLLDGKKGGLIDLGKSAEQQQQMSEEAVKQKEKAELEQMGQQVMRDLAESPDFSDLMNQIKVEFVDEGLRIEIMESVDDVFFEVGTSQLKPKAVQILKKIGERLSLLPNKVILEGHTDSRPYGYGNQLGYTNYELSADRANSARRAMVGGGLTENHFDQIRGYADKRLKDPKDPYNVVNRRISIIVKYAGKHG